MSPKVILITGGTSGLGRSAARKFLTQGHTVVITGRNEEKLKTAATWINATSNNGTLHCIAMDLSNLASIDKAVETLQLLDITPNVLINNAGVVLSQLQYTGETNVVEETIFVNAIAPWYLSLRLIPLMKKSYAINLKREDRPRILFVSSSLHDPANKGGKRTAGDSLPEQVNFDNLDGAKSFSAMQFYRISKIIQLWLTFLLAKLNPELTIFAFSPGFVPSTGLNRHSNILIRVLMSYVLIHMSFATTEDEAANDYAYYATSGNVEGATAEYYQKRNISESSEESRNHEKAKRFWNITCDICNIAQRLD
ncbi:hypothetical protein BX666DRAFT_1969893 [Dichotomocladium elegans]|nr:hypothetical protein BX666DRAFT_1969893 [Dichotomocladium elegans]